MFDSFFEIFSQMPVDLEWCISSHFAQFSFDLKGFIGISAGGFTDVISFKVMDLTMDRQGYLPRARYFTPGFDHFTTMLSDQATVS